MVKVKPEPYRLKADSNDKVKVIQGDRVVASILRVASDLDIVLYTYPNKKLIKVAGEVSRAMADCKWCLSDNLSKLKYEAEYDKDLIL